MMTYLLLILGFVLLIKGADFLVDGSASLAKKYNISNIVIGLTIVAFGTSTPELIVSLIASMNGNTEIAIGNVVGSNIVNIFFILGVSATIYPLATKSNTIWKEIPMSLLAALLLWVMANDQLIDGDNSSMLSRIDGIVFLAFFIIFIYYTVGIAKSDTDDSPEIEIQNITPGKSFLFIVLGLAGLIIGGKWIVDGAVALAKNMGLSESLIGLTIVAVGTSLPELAASAVAAYKKQTDIAIGNVVGSNIFNIFLILGISSLIKPLPFTSGSNIDVMVACLASIVLFVLLFVGKKHIIQKWQGLLMILIYVIYVGYLVMTK
ncbi:MAG: calcium/sodium antiporter [Saprospiraceae bacterium]|nr:calcium/sodium antiporter [Saprospiraceae bacterium]MBK8110860.1 calcium/sodium antiporter [Saprospiraceae bacterium]MBK8851706.1 calcium/sodium antiporter [Saprospiraceae bacterium]